ncbi:YdcF family protein [Nocardia sp. CDC153]|uniref:YdcF family protein n=1 Tax=Nocardia sp. CDC153 TaxID=3112167 RepID=UPI002DBE98F4|nr:YdcF family protein [Nocardia sp. CDC153]MEC3953688.1 YdcF family protein [Nocardia sp. CDC153]
MVALGLGILGLGIFALRVRREPRRLGNGVVLLIALAFTVIGVIHTDSGSALSLLAAVIIVLSPLLVLVLAGLLMVNGILMVRREGLRVANLLSFGVGVALLAPYVLFVVALYSQNLWFAATLAAITLMIGYIGFVLLAFLLYSFVYLRLPYPRTLAAIVVHGSGLIGARVPPLLASRLDKALDVYRGALRLGRRPLLVTSGGKGSDEAVAEADAMADYLVAAGLPAEAILREDRSTTTRENLLYSRDLLASLGAPIPVVLVTSNFHALRTGILARKLGLPATVVGSPTAFYYVPSAILREFVGILFEHKWAHTLACLALAALPLLAVATLPADPGWH